MLLRDSGPHIKEYLQARVRTLNARVEDLEEEIRELRAVISPPGLAGGFLALGFTKMQSAILAALMGSGTISRDRLVIVMYPDASRRCERNLKTIDQHVSLLRHRLRRFGLTVHSSWGVGYYLDDQAKAELRLLLDGHRIKQAAE